MIARPLTITYLSWQDFEVADPARGASPERDLGLVWRSARREATYRAAWVEATGELIAVRHGVPPEGGRVMLLGRMDADEVERRLDGWEEMVGEPGSFEWLVAHAAPHARPVAAKARALDLAG
jgi:hypothetical protein